MKYFLALIALASFSLTRASGQIKRNLGDFNKIKVSNYIPVKLVKSTHNYAEITGKEADNVSLVNKNGQLKVKMAVAGVLDGNEVSVTLYYTHLDEIFTDMSSTVTSDDVLTTPDLTLKSNKGAVINLKINTKALDATTNSSGAIQVTGNTDAQNIISNSGGQFEGKGLQAKNTVVSVNAGGKAVVTSSQTVNAKTRGGGSIDIFGGARVKKSSFAGGTILVH